jgi:hypothetical protein
MKTPQEELDEAHAYLDVLKVPRARDDNGAINSLKTRIEISTVAQRLVSNILKESSPAGMATVRDLKDMMDGES